MNTLLGSRRRPNLPVGVGGHAACPRVLHSSRRTRRGFGFGVAFKCLFPLTFSPRLLSCYCASVLSSAARPRGSDIMHSFLPSVHKCLWSIFNLDPHLEIFRSWSTLRHPSYPLPFFPFLVALIDGVEGSTLPVFILYGNVLRAPIHSPPFSSAAVAFSSLQWITQPTVLFRGSLMS